MKNTIETTKWDTSNVTNMGNMFANSSSIMTKNVQKFWSIPSFLRTVYANFLTQDARKNEKHI